MYDEDLNYWQRNWDYISTDTEINNFWNVDNLDVIIAINGSHRLEKSEFHLLKVQKALVNGEEKTYVKFSFSGEAYGVYDAYKEHEGFAITNGMFEGYID